MIKSGQYPSPDLAGDLCRLRNPEFLHFREDKEQDGAGNGKEEGGDEKDNAVQREVFACQPEGCEEDQGGGGISGHAGAFAGSDVDAVFVSSVRIGAVFGRNFTYIADNEAVAVPGRIVRQNPSASDFGYLLSACHGIEDLPDQGVVIPVCIYCDGLSRVQIDA